MHISDCPYALFGVSHFQTVTAIGFAVNHIQNLILHLISHVISGCPVVSRARALLMHIKVFRIVDILVRAGLNSIDHSRFEIEKDGSGDVARVIGLVKEDVFAITTFRRKVFEISILIDAMLQAELAPELRADWNCR